MPSVAKLHIESPRALGPRVWRCSRPRSQRDVDLDLVMGRSVLSAEPCRLAGLQRERRHQVSVSQDPRYAIV